MLGEGGETAEVDVQTPTAYLAAFVVATLAVSWGLSFLTITDSVPDATILAIMLTPAVVALVLSRLRGRGIVATFVASIRGWTAPSLGFGLLYPLAFIGVAALLALGTGLGTYQPGAENAVGQAIASSGVWLLPVWFLLQGLIIYGEELGWRGYLLPALTDTYGRVAATAAVGVVWGLYHAPVLYLGARVTGLGDPPFVTLVQAGAVFTISFPMAYSYFLTDGSVLPAVVLHLVWNVLNPWVLGNVYSNVQGLVAGRVILVSGEGVVGVVLGAVAMVGFLVLLRRGVGIGI